MIRALRFPPLFLLALLLPGLARAANKESAAAAEFWTADRVHTIHFRVTAKQWQMMQPTRTRQNRPYMVASAMAQPSTQPSTKPVLTPKPQTPKQPNVEGERLDPNFYGMQFAYVKAQFECDGVTLADVGLKQRGNSSYNWAQSNYRRPFKVDFKHFVDEQKFLGISEFYLNNNAYDPSFVRETMAYETFRNMGVPAPRTTYALVYLTIEEKTNREYLGLYTLIEDIDSKAFLKHHFGSAKGLLLKPWLIRGFPYLGEQWEPYEPYYTPRTDPTPQTARRTIDFLKLVNYADDQDFARRIDDYLNVDEFLRWLAGQIVLSNLDNPLYTGHNFYLYLNPKDNRFYIMPWDMNLAFANFTSVGSADQLTHLSMMHPHSGETKIVDRLLAIPRFADLYRGHIKQAIATHFNPQAMFPRIDALQKVLARADEAADAAWQARFAPPATKPSTNPATQPATRPAPIPPRPVQQPTGWRGMPAVELKTFVTRRIEALNAQFAGETDGFVPGRRQPPTPPVAGLRAPASFGNLPILTLAAMRGADANFDHKLTRGELQSSLKTFFVDADSAKQDSLDQMKLAIGLTKAMQQIQTPSSRTPSRGRDWRGPQPLRLSDSAPDWARAVIRAADNQNTGKLTLPQLLAAADRAFSQADKDRSQKLDDLELLDLLDTLASPPQPPATKPSTAPSTLPATRPVS